MWRNYTLRKGRAWRGDEYNWISSARFPEVAQCGILVDNELEYRDPHISLMIFYDCHTFRQLRAVSRNGDFLMKKPWRNLMETSSEFYRTPMRTVIALSIFFLVTYGPAHASQPSNQSSINADTTRGWAPISVPGAPLARSEHNAIWTGSEMIIWGGYANGIYLGDGGRYNLSTNSWSSIATNGAPSARVGHTAIWTGSEMIIWGGYTDGSYWGDGARYNPGTNTWAPVSTDGAPSPRSGHTAVWTGTEMIIWGGSASSGSLHDGTRYNPAANTWTSMATESAPSARSDHSAVWTGSEMIVWGGFTNAGSLGDGSSYNPSDDSWISLPSDGAPQSRNGHTALWTGSEMIIWGGWYNEGLNFFPIRTGARYNPGTQIWTPISITDAPTDLEYHRAVWTGSEMLVWGCGSGNANIGASYDLATDLWSGLPPNDLAARSRFTWIWTGNEALLWGGSSGAMPYNDGRRLVDFGHFLFLPIIVNR